jgi:hydrogenase maturation protease
MNLLPLIETADRLLILDAIQAGIEPGAPVRLDRQELPRVLAHKLSPHQIDLKEVLALAELRGHLPAEALALGIQPETIELDDRLSSPVAAGLPLLLERAVACLRDWGHEVTSQRR